MNNNVIIGITLGDLSGIGTEIAIKTVISSDINNICIPLLIGNESWVKHCSLLFFPNKNIIINSVKNKDDIKNGNDIINVFHTSCINIENIVFGENSADFGKESVLYLETAVALWKRKIINSIVTCPINKKSIELAGFKNFHGHTEFFAKSVNCDKYLMLFYSHEMKLALVTRHISLLEVPSFLTTEKIIDVIDIIYDKASLFDIEKEKIRFGICALNPHAGEASFMGKEEKDIIIPAINHFKNKKLLIEGPFSADTLFIKENRNKYDFIVSMYHDQGLIPFKMLAFDTGVNVTLGLPFIRTSVDHGTAFDIAGKGCANPESLKQAVKLVISLRESNHD